MEPSETAPADQAPAAAKGPRRPPDLTTGPNDVQAAVDTAASHADAIAAAKVAHAVRAAPAQPALPH